MSRLVVTRRAGERIIVGGTTAIEVLSIHGGKCRIGIVAPKETPIVREEILRKAKPCD